MGGLTIDKPIKLFEAFTSPNVIPGDTLWLYQGTYTGNWECHQKGSAALPITIRPYPGHRVIIDGSLTFPLGDYGHVNVVELEFTNSNIDRGSVDGPEMTRATGINVLCDNPVNIINCVIHDVGVAIGLWSAPGNCAVYGNLTYNYGWMDINRGHGHAIYTQNYTAATSKTIKRNIFATGFGGVLRLYTNNGECHNMTVEECISIGSDNLLGGQEYYDNLSMINSHCWKSPVQLGYTFDGNGAVTFTGNRVRGAAIRALTCSYWLTPTITGNKFIGVGDGVGVDADILDFNQPTDQEGLTETINNNAYHYINANPAGLPFWVSWNDWKALGYDAASTFVTTLPATNEAFVYVNEYADANSKRMGIIVVWNWQELDTVTVDITTLGLSGEANYILRNVQDYDNDTVTFTGANSLDIDMRAVSHTIATPIGWAEPLTDKTFPTFGAFVVEKSA